MLNCIVVNNLINYAVLKMCILIVLLLFFTVPLMFILTFADFYLLMNLII